MLCHQTEFRVYIYIYVDFLNGTYVLQDGYQNLYSLQESVLQFVRGLYHRFGA